MFKINLDLKNFEKLKGIAKRIYDDDSEYSMSVLLNRYLQDIN